MDNIIAYGAREDHTGLLGPGDRAVLWVHGCCFDCPGCIAPGHRNGPYQTATPEEMAQWFRKTGAEGLTISGGEPMLQAGALAEMVVRIRRERDAGVIVYTGFLYEQLLERAQQDPGISAFLAQTDLLIDGPYREEEDHNEPARGSANQRLIHLTDRYRDAAGPYYLERKGREIEVRLAGDRSFLVGVPSREQAAFWRKISGE